MEFSVDSSGDGMDGRMGGRRGDVKGPLEVFGRRGRGLCRVWSFVSAFLIRPCRLK